MKPVCSQKSRRSGRPDGITIGSTRVAESGVLTVQDLSRRPGDPGRYTTHALRFPRRMIIRSAGNGDAPANWSQIMRRTLIIFCLTVLVVAVSVCLYVRRVERMKPLLRAAPISTANSTIRVSPNTHVSSQFARFDLEFCDIASDPSNASRLFATVLRWRGNDLDVLGFYSHDGGISWLTGCERLAESGKRLSDTSVAFALDGTLYLTHMRDDPAYVHPLGTQGEGNVELTASTDGGASWSEGARIPDRVDRPWLVVDTTNGIHQGRIYCVVNVDEPACYVSNDSGSTLAGPTYPHAGKAFVNCRHAEPVVGADGSVIIVAKGTGKRSERTPRLYCYRSTDGGHTFVEQTPVNTEWRHDRLKSSQGVETFWPRLAADTNSQRFAGQIYCVWGDGTVDGNGERILFSSSGDYGQTWSEPVVISEQPMDSEGVSPEYMSFKPSIAVSNTGAVAVSWYDRRGMPAPVLVPTERKDVYQKKADGWNVRLRISLDGGATWVPSVQINEEPGVGPVKVGHAAGLTAAADGSFHPVWIDNRTGKRQLWTTRIEFDNHK